MSRSVSNAARRVLRLREAAAGQKAVKQFLRVSASKGPLSKQRKKAPTPAATRRQEHKMKLLDATVAGPGAGGARDRDVGFPVYYPNKLAPGSSYAGSPARTGQEDGRTSAWAPTGWSSSPVSRVSTTVCRACAGRTRPILDRPSETRKIGGREYPALLQRRPPEAGRLEDRAGLVLGLEHAAPDAVRG